MYMYMYMYVYIYIYKDNLMAGLIVAGYDEKRGGQAGPSAANSPATGVCEINTPLRRAFALQSRCRNCSPAPDLAL